MTHRVLLENDELIISDKGGFISKQDLCSLLDQLCAEIKYPITLMCLDRYKNITRIDSARVGFLLDKSCDAFRRFGGYDSCLENDIDHAKPYLYNEKDKPSCGYEVYTCKFMGYREYLFPIEIDNYILAVLFVGQIHILNDESIINTKRNTLDSYKEIIQNQLANENNTDISYEMVANRILSNEQDPFSQINMPSGYDVNKNKSLFENEEIVNKYIENHVYPNIIEFQTRITYALMEFRKKQISKTLANFENNYNERHIEFLKKYDSIEEEGTVNISEYWKLLNGLFNDIKDSLFIHDFVYYEQKRETDQQTYEIKMSTYPELMGTEAFLNEKIINTDGYIPDERAILRYVLKLNFCDCIHVSQELKEHILLELQKTMKSTVNICSYAIRSKVDSNNNLTTLRIYRHEMDQLIFTLGSINFKLSPKYRNTLDEHKIEKMHNDFTSSLAAAHYIQKNIEFFTYNQQGKENDYGSKERIDIFNKLNKWKLFMMDLTINKHCEILIPSEEERIRRNENIKSIYCIENGLESILYNVLNNAIKYCYRGTNIYIDCKNTLINDETHQKITITDYGKGINTINKNDIFKLYYRDTNFAENMDGSGIGLYLSKMIADDIGIILDYHCTPISKFNVPLIERYYKLHYDDPNIIKPVKDEFENLSENALREIVSAYSNRICDDGVSNDFFDSTYKVTFEVII